MRTDTTKLIASLFQIKPDLSPVAWAEQFIDYSRVKNYDSDWKGPYRTSYLPYIGEILESCASLSVKEVWMWACTRGGKSENAILTIMRWLLATTPPYAMAYVGGQQDKVEQFFEKRIIRGMGLSAETKEVMRRAKRREHTIDFDGVCDLVVSWANNKQIAKGDSFPYIFADEVSSWPSFKADTLRERQATVPFPKLIGVSSADAESRRGSDEDPIIQEWENTDRREYMMPDPGDRTQRFRYVMGGRDTAFGVKWDQGAKRDDGTWDMEVVENTAYYQTPAGARIEEKDRMALCAEGVWVPTAKCIPSKRGYRVTRMMTPFPTGAFGNMARTFLEAKRKQDAGQFDEDGRSPLRVFVYERLAEKFYATKFVPELTQIDARRGTYKRTQRVSEVPEYAPLYVGKKKIVLMTVDVQKSHEWWLLREWIEGGDSGLVDCGQSHGIAEIREIGVKAKIAGLLIDNSYEERAREFIEAASGGVLAGAVLCYGRDNIRDKHGNPQDYVVYPDKDPYEGTARQGLYRVHSVTHLPDRMKTQLFALTNAAGFHEWRIPSDMPPHYAMHMTAEQCIDGHWERIRKTNHLWDCEVLQLVGVKLFGMWRETETLEPKEPEAGKTPAPIPAPEPEPAGPHEKCGLCGKPMKFDGQRYWMCRCGNVLDTQAARGYGSED